MAIKNKSNLSIDLNSNITDPQNGQNTASRVRSIVQDVIDSNLNVIDSQSENIILSSSNASINTVASNTALIASKNSNNTGVNSLIIGDTNVNSGAGSFVCGANVINTFSNSIVTGTTDFVTIGRTPLSVTTADATPTNMLPQFVIPNTGIYSCNFRFNVLGVDASGNCKEWRGDGLIKSTGATFSMIGVTWSSVYNDTPLTSTDLLVQLNYAANSIDFLVTGIMTPMVWGATIDYEKISL